MRRKIVWVANGTVIFFTIVFLFIFLTYGSGKAIARQNLPGPASPTGSTNGLAFATFSDNHYGVKEVAMPELVRAYSVDETEHILQNEEPSALFTQSPPSSCEADQIIASPNGRFLITQYLCHADTSFQLSNIVDFEQEPKLYPRSYFLNWSPDGDWLLLRKIDQD